MGGGFRVKRNWVSVLIGLSVAQSLGSAAVSGAPTPIPAVPAQLTAKPGNAQVALTWSAITGATSYHLKRSTTSGGPYTLIASPTFSGYTNVGLKNGVTYYYVVSAVDSAGESANSTQVSARPTGLPVPAAPTGVTAVAGNAQIALTWSAVTGATSYHLKRSTTSGGPYTLIASPTVGGYTNVGLTNGVTYYYVVSAVDSAGESANSVQVSATADPPPPPASGLPIGFFSQSLRSIAASHTPSVPFGGLRLWDTNTSWAEIEISRGTYTWTELDMWLRWASSNGKDSMYTFGRVPHWAASSSDLPPSDIATGDNQWKEFVTAIVEHSLSSPDLHIAYYEMWNEPDLQSNWAGTAAQMVTMVKDAYTIIHSLDPNAKVIGPSPSTANQYGVHFLPGYYAAGGATAQDIVGMHAYLYTGGSFSTSPAAITLTISQLQALMATYGISNKTIWLTEGNWNGSGTGSLTEAQEAAYLAQEYMLIWSTGAVSRYYWYSWDNLTIGTLWDETNGIHPAGTAYGLLSHWLVNSTHTANPCSVGSDGTWTCALTLSTGYPAEIIWNPSTSKTLIVDASFVTYETLTNSTVNSIANHTVAIGALPVLIIKSQAQ